MRSLTEAMLYPGVGWLESTNLATGRGTDSPFERIGAPWIDPVAFATALRAAAVPGTRFVPIWFVPRERQYKDQRCGGVQILIHDWNAFDPMKLGLALAVTLRGRYREEWKPEGILTMLGDRASYEALIASRGVTEIESLWRAELERFRQVRARYLIHDYDPE